MVKNNCDFLKTFELKTKKPFDGKIMNYFMALPPTKYIIVRP
jgi:hypothetical protein